MSPKTIPSQRQIKKKGRLLCLSESIFSPSSQVVHGLCKNREATKCTDSLSLLITCQFMFLLSSWSRVSRDRGTLRTQSDCSAAEHIFIRLRFPTPVSITTTYEGHSFAPSKRFIRSVVGADPYLGNPWQEEGIHSGARKGLHVIIKLIKTCSRVAVVKGIWMLEV